VLPRLEATPAELEKFRKNSPQPVAAQPKPALPANKSYPPLETR
jgi:hypothetical protein